MGFSEAVRSVVFKRYFDFSGRSSRSEYWWFVLFAVLFSIGINLLQVILSGIPFIGTLIAIALTLICLALMIPGIAVLIRRLHDVDKSGWFILLNLVPFANLYLIYLLVQPSTYGSNRFGANPLQA